MAPPVPIPNTEVKRPSADDTEGTTLCGKYATARRLIYYRAWKAFLDCFALDRMVTPAGEGGNRIQVGSQPACVAPSVVINLEMEGLSETLREQ